MGKRIISLLLAAALLCGGGPGSARAAQAIGAARPGQAETGISDTKTKEAGKDAEAAPGSQNGGNTGGTGSENSGNAGGTGSENSGNAGGTGSENSGNAGGTGSENSGNTGGTGSEDGGNAGGTGSEDGGNAGGTGNEDGGNAGDAEEPGARYYTITFDMAGGQTAEGITYTFQIVGAGETPSVDSVKIPERVGYLFQGWKDGDGEFYFFDRPVWEDVALYAAWQPIAYTVRFEGGSGIGTPPADMEFTYDEEQRLPENPFYLKGYAFAGWKAGNGEVFQAGALVKNLTAQKDGTVVLRAIWKVGKYSVFFQPNGGAGNMTSQVFSCGKGKKLARNRYQRAGYTFAGWNTKRDGTGTWYGNRQSVKDLASEDGAVITLYAMWKGVPYKVRYDGNGAEGGSMQDSSHVYGTASRLFANRFWKRGYVFAGWSLEANGTGRIYKDRSEVRTLSVKKDKTVTLYAKWSLASYALTYDTNGGKLSASARRRYTMNTATFLLPRPTRKGYDFDGWYYDKAFRSRVGEIKKGSTGNRMLYAKWVRCSGKVRRDAVKLTSCEAAGPGKVKIRASVRRRVASSDDYYYLVYVNPISQKAYRAAAKTYKKGKLSFSLNAAENQGYVVSRFGIAVKKGGKYRLVSNASYVSKPERAARNKKKYRPGETKKGLQYYSDMSEVTECGAKQLFLNLTVYDVCANGNIPYEYNGRTYYFKNMDKYKQIVEECNKRDIVVTMQVMLNWVPGHTNLIHPSARKRGAAPYYTWNIYSTEAREEAEAIFCYLGETFGKKNRYVSNWILGNEVNSPKGWNYDGGLSEHSYVRTYAYAFRALYYAVRSQYANAHVFICTDHQWNSAQAGGYTAKSLIASFQRQLGKFQKGLKWNLAYHAYSYPLTYTNVWEGYGVTNRADTPYVTMRNLKVLTGYIRKKYGKSVRIILSEQGYSSTWGQKNQAAAIAYSYYVAACDPMVDAFIIRSYRDHPTEVAQGLRMGIKGKEAFWTFKYMDTPWGLRYTSRYLKTIHAKSWKKIVPGYKAGRLTRMYRKT